MNKIIMGIDPGYDRMGIGVIDRKNNNDTYIYSNCIQSNKKDNFIKRVLYINKELETALQEYKPDIVVIESLFFAKNAMTAMQVSQARGSILLTVARYFDDMGAVADMLESKIIELTPMQIKNSLVGDGHSDKDKVSYMVYQILKLNSIDNWNNNKHIDDEIDALSIALAGAQYSK